MSSQFVVVSAWCSLFDVDINVQNDYVMKLIARSVPPGVKLDVDLANSARLQDDLRLRCVLLSIWKLHPYFGLRTLHIRVGIKRHDVECMW